MRTIRAKVVWGATYDSPSAAINAGDVANAEYRTVADDEVLGRRIRHFWWTDAALILELDDGQFLNITAGDDQVTCALESTPAVAPDKCLQDDVIVDSGGKPYDSLRTDVAARYTDKVLTGLWFARTYVFIYVRGMEYLILCKLGKTIPDNSSILLWNESQ